MRFDSDTMSSVLALQELAVGADAGDDAPAIDLSRYLTVSQAAWWETWGDHDVRALLCGRRYGKSVLVSYWLVDGAAHGPRGSFCVYVSITREHAEQAMWVQIKEAASLSGVPHKVSESRLSIRFAGGGRLMLAGCDTKKEINKFRSKAIYRAAVDECGAMKWSLLQYLDEDVFEPACMDHGGLRVYLGTPPQVAQGWWYDMTKLGSHYDVLRKTAVDNPHIVGGAEAYFERVLERRRWTRSHPTFRREYLGEHVVDIGELVFPLNGNVDGTVTPGRNNCEALPTHADGGGELDPGRWRYAIGIDLGFVHASSFAVVAAHPGLAERVFIIETEKHVGWITPQIRDRLRELKAKYPRAAVVADAGGYGKPIVEELRRLWTNYVEAAEKSHKLGQVRIVRDAVLAGTLFVLDGPQNDPIRSEWGAMGWDRDDPNVPSKTAEDHASDGVLYALRRLRHYSQNDTPPPPTVEEIHAAARKKKFAAFERQNRAKRNRGRR